MDKVNETFEYIKYIPLLPAIMLWFFYIYKVYCVRRLEDMRKYKKWNDLYRYSSIENKEETLNKYIASEEKIKSSVMSLALMISAMAIFCTLYMR